MRAIPELNLFLSALLHTTRFLKRPMELFSLFIKIAQILMLLAGLAAFLYGAYELGMDLWFRFYGIEVKGHVIGAEERYEERHTFAPSSSSLEDGYYSSVPVYRPTIQYRWPPENGEIYYHRSGIQFEGPEMDRFGVGSTVDIRVLPGLPERARLTGGFTHYLWSGIALTGGLMALVLVSSLFFLHEGLFGKDLSKGISLFRSLSWISTLIILLFLTIGLNLLQRWITPWSGPREILALATGEIRHLPYLLAAKGDPEPGKFLNAAESSFARIPWLGIGFATEALDSALYHGDDRAAARYLAAMSDPATKFPVNSSRALAYAAERGKLNFVKALLVSGIHPDSALIEGEEPIRRAALRNQVAAMDLLLASGARTDFPKRPLILSAIDGKSEEAARFILERTKVDLSWRDPMTNHTFADLALKRGMAGTASLLQARDTPVTLPPFYACIVRGDLTSLAREVPPSTWKDVQYEDATLLHLAVRHGKLVLVHALVRMGCDPNVQIRTAGSEAHTPLIEAVRAGEVKIIQFLIRLPNVRLDQGDYRHVTPLAYALQRKRWDIAELLVEAGANVNIQIGDMDGNTPLHLAADAGDEKHVKWLLAKGADIQFVNYRRLTPLDVARNTVVREMMRGSR